jgi:hypothetical protein
MDKIPDETRPVSSTLKACKKTAQGTALGNGTYHEVTLKGHNKFIMPFQGGAPF